MLPTHWNQGDPNYQYNFVLPKQPVVAPVGYNAVNKPLFDHIPSLLGKKITLEESKRNSTYDSAHMQKGEMVLIWRTDGVSPCYQYAKILDRQGDMLSVDTGEGAVIQSDITAFKKLNSPYINFGNRVSIEEAKQISDYDYSKMQKGSIVLAWNNQGYYQYAYVLERHEALLTLEVGEAFPIQKTLDSCISLISLPAGSSRNYPESNMPTRVLGEKFVGDPFLSTSNEYLKLQIDEVALVWRFDGFIYGKVMRIEQGDTFTLDIGSNELLKAPAIAVRKLIIPAQAVPPATRILDPILELCIDDNGGLNAEFMRTNTMKNYLTTFSIYNAQSNLLNIENKFYTPLTGNTENISLKLTASCGSSAQRDIILLDPLNSPLLNLHFANVLKLIIERASFPTYYPLNDQNILEIVKDYVREKVFPSCTRPDLEQACDIYIDSIRKYVPSLVTDTLKVPLIPIDKFIAEGLGVCRHHAMVTLYFLDGLRQLNNMQGVPYLKGIVQHMRDNVVTANTAGAHVWVTYVNKDEKFHLDTLWNILSDFKSPDSLNTLKKNYGDQAIDNQVLRTNTAVARCAALV